jgi:hypothetical protein
VNDPADASAAPAGRVTHDDRGNAVWNWGQDLLESTTRMLKRLSVTELSLEDETAEKQKQAEANELQMQNEREHDREHGYDPYGRGSTPTNTPSKPKR